MTRGAIFLRAGTMLSGVVFALLLAFQGSLENRHLAQVFIGLAGAYAVLALFGFFLMGRESASQMCTPFACRLVVVPTHEKEGRAITRESIFLRIGTLLSGIVFALLLAIQGTLENRHLAQVLMGFAGAYAVVTMHGFVLMGRESIQRR